MATPRTIAGVTATDWDGRGWTGLDDLVARLGHGRGTDLYLEVVDADPVRRPDPTADPAPSKVLLFDPEVFRPAHIHAKVCDHGYVAHISR